VYTQGSLLESLTELAISLVIVRVSVRGFLPVFIESTPRDDDDDLLRKHFAKILSSLDSSLAALEKLSQRDANVPFFFCSVLSSLGFAYTSVLSRGLLLILSCLIIQVYIILVLVVLDGLLWSRSCRAAGKTSSASFPGRLLILHLQPFNIRRCSV